jgi:phosphoglycerol transferase MdoB-like AlkP superfamily enzyme
MSGLDWRIFGRGGAYAPVSLAPRMHASLALQLRALGYRTVAVYPTDGNFLSAQSAYGYYGFDEFYAARDLHLPDDWQVTYDHVVFDKALQMAQRTDDPRPVFVFVLTIRNHGPHGQGKVPVPPAFRSIEQKKGAPLADYLARMRDSSADFTRLADQWLKATRPRVIAWFGDHQPEAAWDFTEHPELVIRDRVAPNASAKQLQYLTQYQFSANFGERETHVARDAMDIAYLGAQLVAFAELPLDSATSAAHEMAARCNGLLIDCVDRDLVNDYLNYRIYDLAAIR